MDKELREVVGNRLDDLVEAVTELARETGHELTEKKLRQLIAEECRKGKPATIVDRETTLRSAGKLIDETSGVSMPADQLMAMMLASIAYSNLCIASCLAEG